jgi:TetR/AcrR family hemagglutinin/protease transcriptional regulator
MRSVTSQAPSRTARRTRAVRMAPDRRREQLLAAALRLFAAKGFGPARHSDLAEEAGVAVPTVFHYFPTKGDLVAAAVAEVQRFLLDEIVAPNFDEDAPAPIIIERILMAFCDAIDTHSDHVRVWLVWSVALHEGLWDSYLEFYRAALSRMQALVHLGKRQHTIDPELDEEDAARVIVGLAHMIVQMKFSGGTREQVVRTVHSLVYGYLVSRTGAVHPQFGASR